MRYFTLLSHCIYSIKKIWYDSYRIFRNNRITPTFNFAECVANNLPREASIERIKRQKKEMKKK